MPDPGTGPVGLPVRRGVAALTMISLALTLTMGCGASRSVSYSAGVDVPGEAFECVETETGEADFEVEFRNERQGRIVVSRTNESLRRSEPTFQKAVDQLTIDVGSSDSGNGPRLLVTARTFFEYWDRRGRTRRQHDASTQVRDAAQRLLQRCGSPPEESP